MLTYNLTTDKTLSYQDLNQSTFKQLGATLKASGVGRLLKTVPGSKKSASMSLKCYSLKDVRAQKFPRTDFFKTLTALRK